MDVKTIKEIQADVLNIQKYFIQIFDKNIFVVWTSNIATQKYKAFSDAMNVVQDYVKAVNDGLYKEDESCFDIECFKVICKAVYDLEISGYDCAHQIFDDYFLSSARVEATGSACKIADIIGLSEEEMVNGLD